jgi:dolichol kinase
MKINNYLTFIFSFLFSYLVYFLLHSIYLYYYAIPIAVFSSLFLLTYTSNKHYFYFVLAALLIVVFSGAFPIKLSFEIISISMLIQFLLIKNLAIKILNFSSKLEVRRDFVQIVIGVIFLSIFVFSYKQVLMGLVFLGILVAHIIYVYGRKMKKLVNMLEREGVIFGSGAISMAIGAVLMLGFINHFDFLFFSLFSLLISDPIATITGLKTMKKSGRKSIIGSSAFFISSLIPGIIFFGLFGVIFAFILSLAERFNPIDDNIFIAVIAVLLSLVFLV